jgi:GDPmannose 4,6-dehydratase
MKKRALITGITGMDGSHIADLLLEKGYEVFGMKRRTSTDGYDNIKHLLGEVAILEGDLIDQSSLNYVIKETQPDEIYHLAAQSMVGTSFSQPLLTAETTGLGTLRLLEAVREFSPKCRIYNAATSEMFGGETGGPYNEKSPFKPKSPYASAKLFGYNTAVNYRESYGMHISSGILFNHSSPRRGIAFATRKITNTAAKIKLGLTDKLVMGNIETFRDEAHAKDMVEGMWLMLQQEKSDDYVLATGETHSIKEMIEVVFNHLGLDWQKYVKYDAAFHRPSEVNVLLGDSTKARAVLGWKPKYNWKTLLIEMVENDLELSKQ